MKLTVKCNGELTADDFEFNEATIESLQGQMAVVTCMAHYLTEHGSGAEARMPAMMQYVTNVFAQEAGSDRFVMLFVVLCFNLSSNDCTNVIHISH